MILVVEFLNNWRNCQSKEMLKIRHNNREGGTKNEKITFNPYGVCNDFCFICVQSANGQ